MKMKMKTKMRMKRAALSKLSALETAADRRTTHGSFRLRARQRALKLKRTG